MRSQQVDGLHGRFVLHGKETVGKAGERIDTQSTIEANRFRQTSRASGNAVGDQPGKQVVASRLELVDPQRQRSRSIEPETDATEFVEIQTCLPAFDQPARKAEGFGHIFRGVRCRIGKYLSRQLAISAIRSRHGVPSRPIDGQVGQQRLHGPQDAVYESIPAATADPFRHRNRFVDGRVSGNRVQKDQLIRAELQEGP